MSGTGLQAGARAWLDAYEASRTELPGRGDAATVRETAIARFREQGFPTSRDEEWIYTDLRAITRTSFAPAPTPSNADVAAAGERLQVFPHPPEESARLVFVDGVHAPSLSSTKDAGIEAGSLAAIAAEDTAPRLGDLAGRDAASLRNAFQALNTALWRDGAYVRIPRDAAPVGPVHLVFLASGTRAESAVHPRLLVVAEAGAEAAILETWAGVESAGGFHNAVVEVWLEENAKLELLEIQRQPAAAIYFRALHAHVARDSRFGATCFSLGSRIARNDVRVHLDAPGAECRLDGLSYVGGEQRVDHQTQVVHAKPHCSSRQLYKGILDGRAKVAYSGLVHVAHGAQKTDAQQANHNVLLTRDAVADSKPQLEIFADDVKCAHGATVGRLDEEALFYLRTRGLDERAATRLLLDAFAGEIPGRIENQELRRHARDMLALHVLGGY